ncbi:MAG: hypothetical protein HQM12_01345 [SAR324 cluster bacterium]|nr:hypothetical protein [SAR324 cluster bacterium]MBF0351602.1 hypothetical protein [SAR324 cluster bacterium]
MENQHNDVILKLQCNALKLYAEQFPCEEREQKILEWIAKYAHVYRDTMEQFIDCSGQQPTQN